MIAEQEYLKQNSFLNSSSEEETNEFAPQLNEEFKNLNENLTAQKRAKRSKVWNYMKLINNGSEVQCQICMQWTMKYVNSTTNLKYHLKSHKSEYQKLYEKVEEKNNILQYFGNQTSDEALFVFKQIIYIVNKFQPLSTIGNQYFQDLFSDLKFKPIFPSDNMIKKYITNLSYQLKQQMIEKFKKSFQYFITFSLDFDHWTSNSNKQFITINLRFIDEQFQLNQLNLATFQTIDEKGQTISEDIQATLKSYYLLDKSNETESQENEINQRFKMTDIFCTSDGASYNKAAYKNSSFLSFQMICMCHIIHNTILSSIDKNIGIDNIISKITHLATSFKKSPKRTQMLEQELQKQGIDIIKIKVSSKTRWNSILKMLKSINSCIKGIQKLQSIDKELNKYQLTDQEQQLVKQLIDLLQGFEKISKELQSNYTPTGSYILPYIQQINEELKTENDQHFLLKDFKNTLYEQFNLKLDSNNINQENLHLYISSYLNPCFKEEMKENYQSKYLQMIQLFQQQLDQDYFQNILHQNLHLLEQKQKTKKINFFRSNEKQTFQNEKDVIQIFNQEVAYYNQLFYEENDYQQQDQHPVLYFWKQNKNKIPILSMFAQKYLSLSASSAESERVFSSMGNLITKLRNKLDSTLVSDIMFLYLNQKSGFVSQQQLQNLFMKNVYQK